MEVQTLVRMSNTSEHLYTTGWRHLGVHAEEAWRVTKTMFLMPRCSKRDAFIHLSSDHLTSLHALACATWEDFLSRKVPTAVALEEGWGLAQTSLMFFCTF